MFKTKRGDPPIWVRSLGGPYTPTVPGYLAMLWLVFVIFGVTIGGALLVVEESAAFGGVVGLVVSALVISAIATTVSAVLGSLPALLGILLVHLVCRRVRAQWVHVVAFGVAGAVLSGPPLIWLTDPQLVFHPLQAYAGVCAALARLAVTPWVPSVRARREERAAHGR
ncbi:hypothetical protein GCM10027425_24700 [Alteromonas gracilis]